MKVSGKGPDSLSKSLSNSLTSAGAEAGKTSKTSSLGGLDSIGEMKDPKSTRNSSARVDLSSRAQEMARAKELATPADDIDEAKVSRLQKLIDEGKYNIDADAIADRMFDEHSKMS